MRGHIAKERSLPDLSCPFKPFDGQEKKKKYNVG
jgi:hypothetical protein